MRLGKIDPNSFSEPEKILTEHVDINWDVDFEKHVLRGNVTYKFKILEDNLPSILLDIRDIKISEINALLCDDTVIPINFVISDDVKDIGSKLTIEPPSGSCGMLKIQIKYETSSKASALQWLTPEQTLGKKYPYLYSQCQAIHARSLLPCQDTPTVKFSYNATVKHPSDLVALMSAIRSTENDEITKFEQTIPIPSYLLAIAVGKLVFRPIGPYSNIWAEEDIIEECAEEFSETNEMLSAACNICGPYVWKQYDLLVMPPSFPFGGMENPCLTFITPTLLAGDKSLACVVAHEIAHSWTGNLVTNKNFEHFWLNEGFTVFVEEKIIGRLKDDVERDFSAIRNLTELADCIKTQLVDTPELTKLIVDLSNCNPDLAFSSVPYVKGSTFLRYLEDLVGGPSVFEPFLRSYLNKYKYKSIITDDFKLTFYEYFNQTQPVDVLNSIDWDKWLYGEGMPPIIPKYNDSLVIVSNNLVKLWSEKTVKDIRSSSEINVKLTSLQLIDFLGKLIPENIIEMGKDKIDLIENTYELHKTKNSEIRFRFMRLCIKARLTERINEIIEFANSNFRMKFVRPIYRDLYGWPEAKNIAIENFKKVENQMMEVCSFTIRNDLGLN